MKTEQIIKTLKNSNVWNHAVIKRLQELEKELDEFNEKLQALEKERDEARREAMLYRDNFRYSHWFSWEKGSK